MIINNTNPDILQHAVNPDLPRFKKSDRFNGFGLIGILIGLMYFFLAYLSVESKHGTGPSFIPAFQVTLMAPFTDYSSDGSGLSEIPAKPAVANAQVILQP